MTHLGYTKSLVIIFVIPFLFLFRSIVASVRLKPFLLTIATVCLLGWGWSGFLSYHRWWIFSENAIVGWYVFPHLPLEEFVIYPIGGAFSIFLYMIAIRQHNIAPQPPLFWSMLIGTSLVFVGVALTAKIPPHYLHSQLLLYNLPCLLLAPLTSKVIRLRGVFISVAVLGLIGFAWDLLAFGLGWWTYTTVTGIKIIYTPIEDINFYLMAPITAISFYLLFCRWLPAPTAFDRLLSR